MNRENELEVKQKYGNLKGVLFLENYDHIMCKSIKIHLQKRQFEKIGVKNPIQAAEDYYKINY